jgi:LysM repeat protein
MSDIDLWVTDPFKVQCYYRTRFTPTGGRHSCDFTQGYGPEEFMVRNAVKGDYVIETDYYGTHTQKILGPVTLYAEVFTDYARPDEKKQVLAFRLNDRKQVVKVGTVSHSGVNRPAAHAEPFPYQIKKGDTLESIAVKELGDKKYIEGMLKLNPTLSNDGKLPIGQIIMLPANE